MQPNYNKGLNMPNTMKIIEAIKRSYREQLHSLEEMQINPETTGKTLNEYLSDTIKGLNKDLNFLTTDTSLFLENSPQEKSARTTIESKMRSKTYEELVEASVQGTIDLLNLSSLLDHLTEKNNEATSKIHALVLKRSSGENARRIGKNETFGEDNKRLKECLELTKSKLRRELVGSDYPTFVDVLLSKYPKPIFVPSPRLHKDEKHQTNEQILKILDQKLNLNWKDPRLRTFFRKETGQKPTIKSVSSLKR